MFKTLTFCGVSMNNQPKFGAIAEALREEAIRKNKQVFDEISNCNVENVIVEPDIKIESMQEIIDRSDFFEDAGGKFKLQLMLDPKSKTTSFVSMIALLGKSYRKMVDVHSAFFEYNPQMKSIVGKNIYGHPIINIYDPPDWRKDEYYLSISQPIEKEMPEIHQSFLMHLTEGHMDSFFAIVKWMAFSLVGRNPTYLTMVGGKGVGKTIFANSILKFLHGNKNYMTLTNDTFTGQFNSEIDGHTFGYLDELYIKKNARQQMSKLKLLNNDAVRVEKKGLDAFMANNHLNLYVSSNDYEGIPLESGERRLTLPFCTDIQLKETELIHRIKEIENPHNLIKLGRYLLGIAPTFEEVRDPFICPIVEDKIFDAQIKDWERWAFDWFLFTLPEYSKSGEVRFETFQEDFKKENPNAGISPPGKNRVEKFLSERKSLGWSLNKHPTNQDEGIKGYRTFERT